VYCLDVSAGRVTVEARFQRACVIQRGERMTAVEDRSMGSIGERLRLTRVALGMSQVQFAGKVGVSTASYNQYEKGRRRLAIEQAIKIQGAHNLTLDWLYLGDRSGLTDAVSNAIAAEEARRKTAHTAVWRETRRVNR
jgi:transcriptional regulator with XRE-family HTH domain